MEGLSGMYKPYSCTNCKAVFSRLVDFKRHLLIHTDERPHKCTYCDSAFAEKRHLKIHTLTHTGEKNHQCTLCKAAFSDKGNMKRHMRTHTGERPHKCKYCPAAFQQKWHLKVHIMTHTGEKPHKCKLCSASFADKGNLKSHIRTHSNEKPHKCSFCDAAFSRKWNLKSHIMSHTGERKHNCPHCEAAFIHAGDLKRHVLSHTKEKPYKCLRCGVAFTRKGGLKIHTMIHTGEKPHKCSLCQAAFTIKANLRSHIKTHSGKKSQKGKNRNPPLNRKSKTTCATDRTKNIRASDLDFEKKDMKSISFTQVDEKSQKPNPGCTGCTEKLGFASAHCSEESLWYKTDVSSTAEGKFTNHSNHTYENSAVGDNCYADFADVGKVKNYCLHSKEEHLKYNFIGAVFTGDERVENNAHPDVGSQNYQLCDNGLKGNRNLKGHVNTHSSGHMICKVCNINLTGHSLKGPLECKFHNVCQNVKSHMSCHFKRTLNCETVDSVSAIKGRQEGSVRNNTGSNFSGTGKCKSANICVEQDMSEICYTGTYCKAVDSHKGLNNCVFTHDHEAKILDEKQLTCKIVDEKVNNEGNLRGHINAVENEELSEGNVCHIEISGSDKSETFNLQNGFEILHEFGYHNTELTNKDKFKILVSTSGKDFQRSKIDDTQCNYSERNEKSIVVWSDFEKQYRYYICSAGFSKELILERHIRTHPPAELHKCIVCNTAFSDLEQVASYVGIHCENHKLGDAECADEERLGSQFGTHCNEKHNDKICDAILFSKEKSKTRSDSHPSDNSQRCKVCDATFTDKRSLRNHIRVHFDGKPHRCTVCDSVFIDKENLEDHMCTHYKETPCKCKLCYCILKDKEKTSKYIISYFEEKFPIAFEGNEKSGHHLITERSEFFTCEYCSDVFLDEGTLMMHNRIPNVSSSQCIAPYSQTYTGGKSPTECIDTVIGPRSLNCTLCDAAFLVKGTANHIRIHTGNKPREIPLLSTELVDGGEKYCIRIYTKDKAHGLAMCRAK